MAEGSQRPVGVGEGRSSSTELYRSRSLLALDIRAQRLGFAVFKGPTKLLDWGIRVYNGPRQRTGNSLEKRISSLLDFHAPSTLVIRKIHVHSPTTAQQLARIIKTIRVEARRRSVGVHVLRAAAVKKFFARSGLTTKHEIALTLAEWFKDIAWKLPNKKKTWQSERFNMVIFDALATGVAFFGLESFIRKVDGG